MPVSLSRTACGQYLMVLVCLLALALPLSAEEYQGIARVIVTSGEVVAEAEGEPPRELDRRAKLHMGDTVRTGSDGQVQLRFVDDAIVALSENSELVIEQYRYQHDGRSDRAVMRLVNGGFRTVTGRLSKTSPDAYELKTALGSIGIRGTNYQVALHNERMAVAVWSGGVRVSNGAGSLDLGGDVAFRFGVVPGPDRAPRGRLQIPDALRKGMPIQSPADVEEMADLGGVDLGLYSATLDLGGTDLLNDDGLSSDSLLEASISETMELTDNAVEETFDQLDETTDLFDSVTLERENEPTLDLKEGLDRDLPLAR